MWKPVVICPVQAFVDQKYAELWEAVYRGRMTGAEAAAELDAVCNQELVDAGYK